MEDLGSFLLINYEEIIENFNFFGFVVFGEVGSGNFYFFMKYEDVGMIVIVNVMSVGDLREKVILFWRNINVFVL